MSFGLGRTTSTSNNNNNNSNNNNNNGSNSLTANYVMEDPSTVWMAASEGHLSVVQECLRTLQMSPDCADENGYTLLQAAASYGHVHIMEWLLQPPQQVSIVATDHDGDTALHHATTVPAAQYLLQHEPALLFQKNQNQQTALEVKQMELQEILDDPDHEDDDEELIQLKAMVEFLQSVSHVAQ